MAGKHRKISRLKITLHATGGTVAGAAVVGVVATTAQSMVVHVPAQPAGGTSTTGSTSGAAVAAAPRKAPAKAAAPKPATVPHGQAKATVPAPIKGVRTPIKGVPAPGKAVAPPAKAPAKAPAPKAVPVAPFAPPKAAVPRQVRAADVIKLAKSQVGIAEDSRGDTKFQDWYMSTNRAKETVRRDGGSIQDYESAAWCSMFISWLGDRLGFSSQMGADAWTIAHARWFQARGRWGSKPIPGAVVFFDWGGGKSIEDIDHVGLVVRSNGDGTIQTIEGNTSNAVMVRERSSRFIVGYGYPDYAK